MAVSLLKPRCYEDFASRFSADSVSDNSINEKTEFAVSEENFSKSQDYSTYQLVLQQLLTAYKRQMASHKMTDGTTNDLAADTSVTFNTHSEELVFAGGLQQYLIRQAQKQKYVLKQPRRCDGSSPILTFHDLPDSLQLEIFAHLSAVDLCRVSSVCKHWLMLTSDDLLWQCRLHADIHAWNVIGHNSHPDLYVQKHPDWPYKEIYLRCSPEVIQMMRQEYTNFTQLSSILRSFLPKKTPKLALFGPGLESSTSGLVRKILEQETELFKAIGMFPGSFGGVGSGFTMRMGSSLMFHLSTLYAANRQDREAWQEGERLKHSKLLHQVANDDREGHEVQYELDEHVKAFCRSLHGLVFMVDATQSPSAVAESRGEMLAMLGALEDKVSVPMLVLSCAPEQDSSHMSCIDITRHLRLSELTIPWQVHCCVVDNLAGVQQAFEWIIKFCNQN